MTDEITQNDCQGERCSVCGGYGFYRENDGDFRTCGCPKGDNWPAPSSREIRMTDNRSLGNIFTNMLTELEKDLPQESTARHLLYSHRVKIREAFDGAASAIRRAVIDECIQAIKAQRETFASSEYATGQPRSSFGERFACKSCIEALEGLKGETDNV